MGASTEEATALRPNPQPFKSIIAENMYNGPNENQEDIRRTPSQIYFRRKQVHATETHISMCTFGSDMKIWRDPLNSAQIDIRRKQVHATETHISMCTFRIELNLSREIPFL